MMRKIIYKLARKMPRFGLLLFPFDGDLRMLARAEAKKSPLATTRG